MSDRIAFNPPPGTKLGETDYSIPGQICASDNFRYVDGRGQPIGGWSRTATSIGVTAYVVAMLEWVAKDGVRRLALGGTDKLSIIYGATLSSQTTVTPGGFASTTNNRWTFDLWGDHLIACLSGGGVFEWQLGVGVAAAAVTNAPTQNVCALVTGTRQLLVGGTKEEISGTYNPRCIRGSTYEDNTVWTTLPSNQAFEFVLDGAGGEIKAMKNLPGGLVGVWTTDEVFVGHDGGSLGWIFDRVASGCGAGGVDGVCVADGTAYWVTPDTRLMMWVPGSEPIEMPGVPKYYLNGTSTLASLALAYVWHNAKYNEIWFHLSTNATFPTGFLAVSVPSLQTGNPIWFPGTLSRSCMYQGINGCYGYSVPTLKLMTHETGKAGYNGAPGDQDLLSWSVESLVYLSRKGKKRVQIQCYRPDFEAQAGNITFTLSGLKYPQGDETVLQTRTITAGQDKDDFRAGGNLFRLKWSGNDTSGNTFARFGEQNFDIIEEGDR
jgi:hypothetical protein